MHRVPAARALRFDVFTLDLSRCVLLRGDDQIALRPKSFDVLHYLAEHPNRLVSKEELLDKIWPGITVTEGSLVQCIKDIRQALGDTDHRIIRTVPKRGYLLAASATDITDEQRVSAPGSAVERIARLGADARSLWSGLRIRAHALAGQRKLALVACGFLLIVTAVLATERMRAPLPPNANASHYALLGRAAFDRERSPRANKEALAYFDKALALDPNNVAALLGYARSMMVDAMAGWVVRHERPTRLQQALVAADRAIALEPNNSYAHYLRGVVLRGRGEPEQALPAFDRALQLNPNHAYGYAERGRALIEIGRAAETVSHIKKAISLDPTERDIANWYFWAGQAELHLGNAEEAVRWLLKARSLSATTPLLAVAYAELGREEEARALIAQHLEKTTGFSIWQLRQSLPVRRHAGAAKRHEDLFEALRKLGVPEGTFQTGSTQ
jgi:DNA-binding winged helix-turn-helix (wHTH) protein/Flp pilus assembly protein TadD